jgi:hypothetical protein
MKITIHIIMGLNQESSELATYLKQRREVVYICDDTFSGIYKRKDFTFVDQQFVDSIDHTIFKVYVYKHPYKKGHILQGTRSFMMEKKEPG